MKCPNCKSEDVRTYKDLCGNNGINWKGEVMYWCGSCNNDFTDTTPVIAKIIPQAKGKKQKELTNFYVTNSGKKVYY